MPKQNYLALENRKDKMTVEINYVDGDRGVIYRLSEVVTGKEIIAAQDKIYEKHKKKTQQYHIIDKSWCTEYDVNVSEINIIARLDCKMTERNPQMIMAVIESQHLMFNLTELWQAYIEDSIQYSESFTNQVDALRWVKQLLQITQYESVMNCKNQECMTLAGN